MMALVATTGSNAADLIGSTLTYTRLYPDAETVYLGWNPYVRSGVVAEGNSDRINWEIAAIPGSVYATVDADANVIAWGFNYNTGFIGSASVFDGFSVMGFEYDIASVSVLSASQNIAVEVSHTARSVFINLAGIPPTYGPGEFQISVSLVPEPMPSALMLAGLIPLMAFVRRKASKI